MIKRLFEYFISRNEESNKPFFFLHLSFYFLETFFNCLRLLGFLIDSSSALLSEVIGGTFAGGGGGGGTPVKSFF